MRSAPSSGNGPKTASASGSTSDYVVPSQSHAVSRSSELLSCARTALRLGQDRHRRKVAALAAAAETGGAAATLNGADSNEPDLPEFLLDVPPSALSLHRDDASHDSSSSATSIDDAQRILTALDSSTSTLSSLVRRRGHTNDPTSRIDATVSEFHVLAKELAELTQHIRREGDLPMVVNGVSKRSGRQRKRHYELVADAVQKLAEGRVERFKKILEIRGEVIRDQNRRRRLLNPSVGKQQQQQQQSRQGGGAAGVPGAGLSKVGGATTVSQLSSPLFTMTDGSTNGSASAPGAKLPPPPPPPAARSHPPPPRQHSAMGSGGSGGGTGSGPVPAPPPVPASAPPSLNGRSAASLASAAIPYTAASAGGAAGAGYGGGGGYGGYGGSAYGGPGGGGYGGGGAGYGGYGAASASGPDLGMRQRRGGGAATSSASYPYQRQHQQQQQPYDSSLEADSKKTDGDDLDSASSMQSKIQTRRARRETQSRLESARAAESKLAELGTMFTKMANLVSAQGEVLTKVEDDVEAALGHVEAGHEEIQTLYSITKGNRGLILKVFGILIFLIIFMRFY